MQKLTIEQAREKFKEVSCVDPLSVYDDGTFMNPSDRQEWYIWLICLRANGLLVESET